MNESVPYSQEAEAGVLGSLLLDGEKIHTLMLKPEHFFLQEHQLIFEAMSRLDDINQITVASELARMGNLIEVGGVSYLSQLIAQLPSSLYLESYAQIVERKSHNRRLISTGDRISVLGHSDKEIEESLAEFELITNEMITGVPVNASGDIKVLAHEIGEEIMRNKGEEIDRPCLFTGVSAIDEFFGGLINGESICVYGPTSIGKTELALNIFRNICISVPGILFSEEMTKKQAVYRMAARIAKLPMSVIYHGRYSSEAAEKMFDACLELYNSNMRVEQVGTVDMMRVFVERYQPKFVVIDHIQQIEDRGKDLREVTSNIAKKITRLAKDYDIPVLALSQMGRDATKIWGDRGPFLNAGKESGEIENRFDTVWGIHRPGYFEYQREGAISDWTTEVWVLKDRLRCKLGKFSLAWDKDHQCYDNSNPSLENEQRFEKAMNLI